MAREAELLLVAFADATIDPDRTLSQMAQGRRAETLRKRVRDGAKARLFSLRSHGTAGLSRLKWPIDFLQAFEEIVVGLKVDRQRLLRGDRRTLADDKGLDLVEARQHAFF